MSSVFYKKNKTILSQPEFINKTLIILELSRVTLVCGNNVQYKHFNFVKNAIKTLTELRTYKIFKKKFKLKIKVLKYNKKLRFVYIILEKKKLQLS